MIDLKKAYLYACACEAAYELDEATRLALLNAVGLVQDQYVTGPADARALICRTLDGAEKGLFFQGTQFTDGEIPSIFANLDVDPVDVGGGAEVADGYWSQLHGLLPELDVLGLTVIGGHSMGGALARLFGFATASRLPIWTFGRPKCGNAIFEAKAGPTEIRIVNARDPAPLWPFFPTRFVQDFPQQWLYQGTIEELHDARPVTPDCIPDHFIGPYKAAILGIPEIVTAAW